MYVLMYVCICDVCVCVNACVRLHMYICPCAFAVVLNEVSNLVAYFLDRGRNVQTNPHKSKEIFNWTNNALHSTF